MSVYDNLKALGITLPQSPPRPLPMCPLYKPGIWCS